MISGPRVVMSPGRMAVRISLSGFVEVSAFSQNAISSPHAAASE